MTKFYLIVLLFAYGCHARIDENTPTIQSEIDTQGLIPNIEELLNNILDCLKEELVSFNDFDFDDEIEIVADKFILSQIHWKNLLNFEQDIKSEIKFIPGIVANVNVTLVWLDLELGTDYDLNLGELPPISPGKGSFAVSLENSGAFIAASIKLPAVSIASLRTNLIPGIIQFETLKHNGLDMKTAINEVLKKHGEDIADILNYLINDLLKSIIASAKNKKAHPIVKELKAKGAKGIERCFEIS